MARNAIILPGWRLVQVSDDVKRPFTFKLSHDGMNDCFFSADSSDSYETWMAVRRVLFGGKKPRNMKSTWNEFTMHYQMVWRHANEVYWYRWIPDKKDAVNIVLI